MAKDPNPNYPARDYRASRILRVAFFSLVVGTVLVSLIIVAIQWIWDSFIAEQFNRGPYQVRVEFVLPAILIVAIIMAWYIWDDAERHTRGPAAGRKP